MGCFRKITKSDLAKFLKKSVDQQSLSACGDFDGNVRDGGALAFVEQYQLVSRCHPQSDSSYVYVAMPAILCQPGSVTQEDIPGYIV